MPTIEQEKELLIAAAKAMGIEGELSFHIPPFTHGPKSPYITLPFAPYCWNPYRNAEQLNEMRAQQKLTTRFAYDYVVVRTEADMVVRSIQALENYSDHQSPQAAEAWCALRVVAEIGKEMP